MSSTMPMKCYECQKEFSLKTKEFRRKVKNGRPVDRFFCSRSCTSSHANRFHTTRRVPASQWGNQYSKKGEFAEILKRCRTRAKKAGKPFDIDDDYLIEIWEKQNGLCSYTKIPMIKPKWNSKKQPNLASLDRIDSSNGYVKGNVQFVCYSINIAKNDFTEEQFLPFIKMLMEGP